MKKKQYTSPLLFLAIFLMFGGVFLVPRLAFASSFIVINGGSTKTLGRAVSLAITPPANAVEMKISNSASFRDTDWEKVVKEKDWVLSYGRGVKRVYVRFKYDNNRVSPI